MRSSIRSEVPEQPELCPQELDSNGAELDLFELEPSEPDGNCAVTTLVSLAISGLLERLPTENARTLLEDSCGVMSNLHMRKERDVKKKDVKMKLTDTLDRSQYKDKTRTCFYDACSQVLV